MSKKKGSNVKMVWKPCKIDQLQPGQFVQQKTGSVSYMVVGNYGGRATAVRTVDITNESEWDMFAPEK